jgi:hypothetical protein
MIVVPAPAGFNNASRADFVAASTSLPLARITVTC